MLEHVGIKVTIKVVRYSPVVVKTPTSRLIPLLPSRVTSVWPAWLLSFICLDFIEAQIPVPNTIR